MDVLTFPSRNRRYTQPLFLGAVVSLLASLGFMINVGSLFPAAMVWVLMSTVALAVAVSNLRQGRHSLIADDRGMLLLIDQTVVPVRWEQIQRLDLVAEHQMLGVRLKQDARVWQQLSPRQLRQWCRITQQQLKLFGVPPVSDGLLSQPDLLHQQQYLSEQLSQSCGFHILVHQTEFSADLAEISGKLRRAHQTSLWRRPQRDSVVTPIDAKADQGTREERALRSGDSQR